MGGTSIEPQPSTAVPNSLLSGPIDNLQSSTTSIPTLADRPIYASELGHTATRHKRATKAARACWPSASPDELSMQIQIMKPSRKKPYKHRVKPIQVENQQKQARDADRKRWSSERLKRTTREERRMRDTEQKDIKAQGTLI
jgi:hypothetical protein